MPIAWVRGLAAGSALASACCLAAPSLAQTASGPEQHYRALVAQAQPGNADADYALALAAIDAGHYPEAIVALQRVLAIQPDNNRARAEIARAYALSGDIDTARNEFATVVNDPTVPDPVRARIGRLVRSYDGAIDGGNRALTGYAEAEVGYDGNINTATGLTSITLPLFAFLGPASLTGAATRMDDGYYQLQAGGSLVGNVSRQTSFYASLLGSWRDNFRSDAFDQGALTGTAGVSHTLPDRTVVSLSGQAQRFWLARQGFRTGVGGVAQVTRPNGDRAAWSVQGQYFRFNYDSDPTRDADRVAGTLSYAGQTWFAGIGAGRERTTRAAARNLGYWFASAQVGTEYPVARSVGLLAGASVEHRDYQATEPLFLKSRTDTQLDLSLGLRLVVAKNVSVRPRATYTRNFSNISLYDYSRVTASVALRAEF